MSTTKRQKNSSPKRNMSSSPKKMVGDKNVVTSKMILQEQKLTYSGPLPHYTDFENYERVLPGAADRILFMAEKQSEHRRGLESTKLHSDVKNSARGQWFGFILGVGALFGGVFLIYSDKNAQGFAIIIGAIASLLTVFFYSKKSEKEERNEKIQRQKGIGTKD